jgi:putative ABC transport system permease protein
VAVFIGMMALSQGFRAALVQTGSRDNALVLRKGADAELSSGLSRATVNAIAAMPFVAEDASGRRLASPEVFVVVNIPRPGSGGLANVVARGVSPAAFEVRKDIRIVEGRPFRPGAAEVVVGVKMARRLAHCAVGDSLEFASRRWAVVGHFTAGGSAFESEIWGENEQFMPAFRGNVFQLIAFRLRDPSAFPAVKKALEDDPRFQVDVRREFDFYAQQSQLLTRIINFAALFITGIMAVGAVFGAINTMYAAVVARAPEIAVLLTLGFRPAAVLACFLAESVVIALVGGLAGCALALPVNGVVGSTTNWAAFTELAFAFRVTPALMVRGVIFAVVMGLLGGFFPARRAARRPIVQALRHG